MTPRCRRARRRWRHGPTSWSSFLVDVRGDVPRSGTLRGHGHLSRFLLRPARARRQAAAAQAAGDGRRPAARRAAGGGDVLRLRRHLLRQVSRTSPTRSSSDKTADIAATGAGTLLAGDLGCLLNMAGKLQREGRPIAARHVAEVLAGMTDDAGDRRGSDRLMQHATSHRFKDNARRALADAQLQRALGHVKNELRRAARGGGGATAGVRGAARPGARHQEPRARQSRLLSRALRGARSIANGGQVHWCARRRGGARRPSCAICRSVGAKMVTKGKTMIGEEIALNDHPRGQRHHAGRDRSRRIHHPAAPRAAEPSSSRRRSI